MDHPSDFGSRGRGSPGDLLGTHGFQHIGRDGPGQLRRPHGLTWSQDGCNPGWHAGADLANMPTRSQMLMEIRFQMKCDEVASRRSGLIL